MGVFLGGVFYAYGFTAAPATAVLFVLAKEQNILSAGIIGGLGALLSDMIIFLFIRYSFIDEIENLKQESIIKSIGKVRKKLFKSLDYYVLLITAFFLIASPFPTEMGIALMATLKNISIKKFLIFAYLLHALGIMIILFAGKQLP